MVSRHLSATQLGVRTYDNSLAKDKECSLRTQVYLVLFYKQGFPSSVNSSSQRYVFLLFIAIVNFLKNHNSERCYSDTEVVLMKFVGKPYGKLLHQCAKVVPSIVFPEPFVKTVHPSVRIPHFCF